MPSTGDAALSKMLANGADLAAVAARPGHQSVAATGSIHTHVTAGSQAKAAKSMPSIAGDTKVIQKTNEKGVTML